MTVHYSIFHSYNVVTIPSGYNWLFGNLTVGKSFLGVDLLRRNSLSMDSTQLYIRWCLYVDVREQPVIIIHLAMEMEQGSALRMIYLETTFQSPLAPLTGT